MSEGACPKLYCTTLSPLSSSRSAPAVSLDGSEGIRMNGPIPSRWSPYLLSGAHRRGLHVHHAVHPEAVRVPRPRAGIRVPAVPVRGARRAGARRRSLLLLGCSRGPSLSPLRRWRRLLRGACVESFRPIFEPRRGRGALLLPLAVPGRRRARALVSRCASRAGHRGAPRPVPVGHQQVPEAWIAMGLGVGSWAKNGSRCARSFGTRCWVSSPSAVSTAICDLRL